MILPIIIVGGAVVGVFGFVKVAATAVLTGEALAPRFKNKKLEHAQRLGWDGKDLEPVIIPASALPGHEKFAGEWLLTESEKERLDYALGRLVTDNILFFDLEVLQSFREERAKDPAMQVMAREKFARLQKQDE